MVAIDELRDRLREMNRRQANWNETFHESYLRAKRERLGRFRRPSAAQREELSAEARRVTGEEFALEMFAFLDELCDGYMAEELPQNRAKLRADVGGLEAVLPALWAYAQQNVELVRGEKDAPRLERAVAAASLDDLRADQLEVEDLLARAWLAAVRAGLDPRPTFEAVAAVSNPGTGGGGSFFQRHLREFEGSLAFLRRVAPELRRSSA